MQDTRCRIQTLYAQITRSPECIKVEEVSGLQEMMIHLYGSKVATGKGIRREMGRPLSFRYDILPLCSMRAVQIHRSSSVLKLWESVSNWDTEANLCVPRSLVRWKIALMTSRKYSLRTVCHLDTCGAWDATWECEAPQLVLGSSRHYGMVGTRLHL